jgi:hypothetical protein
MSKNLTIPETLLTRNEAATFLRMKPQTLAVWATRGVGPKVCKIGRKALYRLNDLQEYVFACSTPRKHVKKMI